MTIMLTEREVEALGDRVFASAAADYLATSLSELKGVAARCGFEDVAVLVALAQQAAEGVACGRAADEHAQFG